MQIRERLIILRVGALHLAGDLVGLDIIGFIQGLAMDDLPPYPFLNQRVAVFLTDLAVLIAMPTVESCHIFSPCRNLVSS